MKETIINSSQHGVYIKNGVATHTLEAGVHSVPYFSKHEEIIAYPNIWLPIHVSATILSKDGVSLTASVNLLKQIIDPIDFYNQGAESTNPTYLVVSAELQRIARKHTFSDILEHSLDLTVATINEQLRINGLCVQSNGDVMLELPRTLQNAVNAQEVARQRAKAELEEARGRTAVLRHYANAARITKENPDVMRLLLGQKAKSVNVAFDASRKE